MITSTYRKVIFAFAVITTMTLSGCAVRYDNVSVDPVSNRTIVKNIDAKTKNEVAAVKAALMSLGPNVDPLEAQLLAHESVNYPKVLANQYRLVKPAYFQNILVNYGHRENGLCWQWPRDMAKHIQARQWKSFDFFHGTANRRRFNEHNSLVVTAKGNGVKEGMLLDPWRNSGELFWVKTTEDPKYHWTRFIN